MDNLTELTKINRNKGCGSGGLIVTALLLCLLMAGCAFSGADRYLGKPLAEADCHVLDEAGDLVVSANTFTLTGRYQIAADRTTIDLGGRIQYTFDENSHWLGAAVNRFTVETVYVQVLFADHSGRVIAVAPFHLYPQGRINDAVPFEQRLPLPAAGAFITFRLTTYLRDGAVYGVSRQIDATTTDEIGFSEHSGIGL